MDKLYLSMVNLELLCALPCATVQELLKMLCFQKLVTMMAWEYGYGAAKS